MRVPKQGWALAAINLGQVYCKSIVSQRAWLFITLAGAVTCRRGGAPADACDAVPRQMGKRGGGGVVFPQAAKLARSKIALLITGDRQ